MADEIVIVVRGEDQFSNVLGNVGSIITGIESAINLVGQAFDFAAGMIQPFIESASESEQAVARLEGVLRATGGAAGLTSDELQGMADALQDTTRFSDETILAGEALLLTFRNITGETFERTVPAMLDMAEIFGSVDSSAMQLGRALQDPLNNLGALSRAGVTFTDEQREMIANFIEMGDIAGAQNIILSEVEAQVSGLAQTMGNTFAGQMDIFNNRLDTVRETIGGALLPILGQFLGMFETYLPVIQDFANVLAEAFSTGDFSEVVSRIQEAFSGIDPSEIAQSLSDVITSIDWQGISQGLADGISSIDWAAVIRELSEVSIIIGNALMEAMSEIDWNALVVSIGGALADAIAGLFGFINWDDMIANARIGFQYVGQSIVDGLRTGLLMAWTNFTNLPTMLFNNFITSVKAVLGIASRSTVFFNIAHEIVNGLTEGFLFYWDNLITIAQNSLDDFLNMFGIDLSFGGSSASGLGTAGGGTSGGGTGTGGASGEVHNYYYGPVYFMGAGEPGAYYDCPAPNPFMTAGSQTVMPNGVH